MQRFCVGVTSVILITICLYTYSSDITATLLDNHSFDPKKKDTNHGCIDGVIKMFDVPSEDDRVRTFQWLCIESKPHADFHFPTHREQSYWYLGDRLIQMPAKQCYIPAKRITLHDPNQNTNFSLYGFLIEPTKQGIPADFAISNSTAYFLGANNLPFEPENLYHFIKQVFFPLYYMLKTTENSNSHLENIVFYNSPLGRCPGKFSRFQLDNVKSFYEMLDIPDQYTSAFEDIPNPNKICYKKAVFSDSVHLNHAYEATEFIKKRFQISSESCHSRLVTFIQRETYRRILNLNSLVETAISLGYDTRIAHFENMTHSEQIQLVHCSEILVGVTGAGLHWAYFMKNNSGVVEIAWPQYQWPFFFTTTNHNGSTSTYSNLLGIRPLRFATLHANSCHLNPDALNFYQKKMFHIASNFTKEESLKILQDQRNYDFNRDVLTSCGKFCDVTVNSEDFKAAILRINQCK